MGQSINLIPQEEKQEQTKTQLVKLSTVFTIILFVIVAGISGYLFYQTYSLKTQIQLHEANITDLRAQIQNQSQIEIIARNLESKYKALNSILTDRLYYSLLLKEVQARLPQTVVIEDFSITQGNAINISGTAETYIAIAEFINALTNKEFVGGVTGLEKLFTSVSLNTVTTESNVSKIKFFIVVSFNGSLIKKI